MKFILTAFALGIATLSLAQTGVVTGKITDHSGQPLSGAMITLDNSRKVIFTAPEGTFMLNAAAGQHDLYVSIGQKSPIVVPVTVVAGDTIELATIKGERQRKTLHEIVVSANKNGYKADNISSSLKLLTPLELLPQNIQVITAGALSDRQILSLKDGVIQEVSGATQLGHWGNYTRINMRGARASEFRNGFNITSSWGPLTADMSMVERIEFVKGPAGFMMANGEPGGMFNIVTKKPTGHTGGSVDFTFGSYDLYRAALSLNGQLDKKNRLQYHLDLMGQTQNSFQKYSFDRRYTIHPVLKYLIDDKTDLTLEYSLQHATLPDLGAPYLFSAKGYNDLPGDASLADPNLQPTNINDHNVFVYLHHHFSDNWKLTVQASYLYATQLGSSIWPSYVDTIGNMIRSVGMFDAINEYKFGQAFLNGKFTTGELQHKVLIGLDMGDKENTYDWAQSHDLDSKESPFNIYNPEYGNPSNGYPEFDRSIPLKQRPEASNISQSYSGVYLQDELGFWDNKVRLTIAGRFTHVWQSTYGDVYKANKVTPRLGLSVSLDKNTSVYALFDQSFIPQNGLLRGDKLPKPETGNNYEIGLKKSWFNGRLESTVSGYRIYKNGLLTSDPDTTGNADHRYSLQLGQTMVQGLELDIRGEIAPGLNAILNYAYTDSKVTKDVDKEKVGNRIPGFAKHIFNGWLTYEIQNSALKGLGFSAGATYRADRSTWSWGAVREAQLSDYFRMDAGIFYQYGKFKINLMVNNLLNDDLYVGSPYGTFYYWQMEAPRNFKVGISYNF